MNFRVTPREWVSSFAHTLRASHTHQASCAGPSLTPRTSRFSSGWRAQTAPPPARKQAECQCSAVCFLAVLSLTSSHAAAHSAVCPSAQVCAACFTALSSRDCTLPRLESLPAVACSAAPPGLADRPARRSSCAACLNEPVGGARTVPMRSCGLMPASGSGRPLACVPVDGARVLGVSVAGPESDL